MLRYRNFSDNHVKSDFIPKVNAGVLHTILQYFVHVNCRNVRHKHQHKHNCQRRSTCSGSPVVFLLSDHEENKHHAARCRIHNGIVEYRDFIPHRGEHQFVVVPPESIRGDIVNSYHHTPHGHAGARRTELPSELHDGGRTCTCTTTFNVFAKTVSCATQRVLRANNFIKEHSALGNL